MVANYQVPWLRNKLRYRQLNGDISQWYSLQLRQAPLDGRLQQRILLYPQNPLQQESSSEWVALLFPRRHLPTGQDLFLLQ